MKPAVGKSGPGMYCIKSSNAQLRVLDERHRAHRRPRRKLCGGMFVAMPNGDARRAVDEQVGNARRQDHRLLERLVVVRNEVDRLFVEVRQQLPGDARHADFGVPHGSRRIAVDGAEVALAVDERVAHGEILRHAHDRVVHRDVAVRDGTYRSRRRRHGPTSCTPGSSRCRGRTWRTATRRCTGLSPSRASGSARPMMTDIA